MCSIIDRQLVVNSFFELFLFFLKSYFSKNPQTFKPGEINETHIINPNSKILHLYTNIHP